MLKALRYTLMLAALMCPTTGFGQTPVQKHFALLERAVEAIEHSMKTLLGIKSVQADLQREYQENEKKPATDALRERQVTIALYYGELERLGRIAMTQIRPPIAPRDMEQKFKEFFERYGEDNGNGFLVLPDHLGEEFLVLEQRVAKLGAHVDRDLGLETEGFIDYTNELSGNRQDDGPVREVLIPLRPDDVFVPRSVRGDIRVSVPVREVSIAALREPLRRLLKLSWEGDRWTVDRAHWDDLFLGKTERQIFEEVKELLTARGVDLPPINQAGERPGRPRRDWIPAYERPNVVHLFENLKSHTQSGGSHSSGGDMWRMHLLGSKVEIGLVNNDDAGYFEFRISEFESPQRTLVVQQQDEGRLHILILGDRVVRVDQDASGRLTVLDSSAARNHRFREDSAAQFCKRHPRYVRDGLFPLLDEMGIIVPSTR